MNNERYIQTCHSTLHARYHGHYSPPVRCRLEGEGEGEAEGCKTYNVNKPPKGGKRVRRGKGGEREGEGE